LYSIRVGKSTLFSPKPNGGFPRFTGRFLVLSEQSFFMKSILIGLFFSAFLLQSAFPAKAQTDSLDIRIGQMIIFGFYGTKIDKKDPVYLAVKEGKVGSILLYRRNISENNTNTQLQKLITDFQSAATIPLFVSIDQEGGLVNRFDNFPGFPPMPSAFFLGNKNDIEATKYYSDNIAYTLSRMGINLNYAPVLDVYNPNCPVLGSRNRCFSDKPDLIAKQAEQVILSHNYFRVHTVVKHFPGHGNSMADSHLGIADVTKTWKKEELEPYIQLIQKGLVEAVMTAHIVNGNLDELKLPATLSKKIITGILRDSLGFDGPVFSDDMMMQAINSQYGIEESIRLALEAGLDLLLFSNNIKGVSKYSPENIHEIIKSLVIKGKISHARIDESYRRIMLMKRKWL
jgi:beta-N-acetylhexosaminidase